MPDIKPKKQLLHLVIGGELDNVEQIKFKHLDEIDCRLAHTQIIQKPKRHGNQLAQKSVDNAHMRYFVIHAQDF